MPEHRVSKVSSDGQIVTSNMVEIFRALSLEACKLSEGMESLLEEGDSAPLVYKVNKNRYIFLSEVLDKTAQK